MGLGMRFDCEIWRACKDEAEEKKIREVEGREQSRLNEKEGLKDIRNEID